MLVADGACCSVDDADRIVVVVGDDQRRAIGGDAKAAGVGLNAEADAFVARAADRAGREVAERNRRRRREAAAAPRVDVDRIVVAAGGIERVAVRSKDQPDVRVGLLEDLRQPRRRAIRAAALGVSYNAARGLSALAPLIDWTSQMTGFWQGRFDQLEKVLERMEP